MSAVIVSGLIAGFLYALLGSGLVIVYRESHVLNFAHGSVGTVAAFVLVELTNGGWPYLPAAVLAVAAAALLSVAIEFLVIRRLGAVSEFTISIATLGVGLLIIGLVNWRWGGAPFAMRPPIKTSWTVHVFGLAVGSTQVIAIVLTLLVFAGLYLLVERTRFGLAMRAVSEGPITADMLGVSLARVRAGSWALAGALAGAAGILISPIYYLDPQYLTSFMITVFAAIVIGGLESIGGVLAGGLIFGVGQALLGYYIDARLSATVAFISIAVMLLFFPNGLFGRRLHKVVEPVIRRSFSAGVTLSAERLGERLTAAVLYAKSVLGVGGIAVLFLVPWLFSSLTVFRLALVAATFIAVLGQNVITGYGGQSSIGQSGFMVVGGYATALLATNYHLSLIWVLLLSMIVSSAVGALLSFTAARLSGVYLALLTLTFALALPELAGLPAGTGGADGLFVPTQTVFGVALKGSTNLYLFCLIAALVVTIVFQFAAQGSPGRRWRAVRDSEAGARSIGIPVERVKIAVVAIGGALAGLAAALTVLLIGYVSPESFTLWTAIYLLAAVVIGGSSSVIGSILGAAFITLVPVYTASYPELPQILFGAAVVVTIMFAPRGLANLIRLPRRDPTITRRHRRSSQKTEEARVRATA
jgi:branched-chain amino acid transport system permease protein